MLKDLLENKKEEVQQKIDEPTTEEYKEIAKYIKTLKNKPVLPTAHLELDLGLDSLEVVELLTFIESTFGVKIDEKTLVEHATIKDLAEYVANGSKEVTHSNVKWKNFINSRCVRYNQVSQNLIQLEK